MDDHIQGQPPADPRYIEFETPDLGGCVSVNKLVEEAF